MANPSQSIISSLVLGGVLAALALMAIPARAAKTDPKARGPIAHGRETLSLAGPWSILRGGFLPVVPQGALPDISFDDTISLPGTTDTERKGPENPERLTTGLTRRYKHVGPAWYQREVEIPESWRGRPLTLFLERTKYTQVWLDGRPCGESPILCTPQEYPLGKAEPGKHRITILVDNSRKPTGAEAHQTSENTQGNWNGIIGRVELIATDPVWLDDVQAYPSAARRTIRVSVHLGNASGAAGEGTLDVSARLEGVAITQTAKAAWSAEGGAAEVEVSLGEKAKLWDEFHPAVGTITVTLRSDAARDERAVPFGLRDFTVKGTQFAVNGRTTFLRGKHDGCVFPLTGHPPMDEAGWLKYLKICRQYGINHIRFHTWTPPEAAFAAADALGMYLQPELPYWGEYNETIQKAMMPEAERILKAYGNHPSFVMFTLGNECGGSRDVMAAMVSDLRARDPRHLYAQGSNNFYWDPSPGAGDDFWTTMRTGKDAAHSVRGSFATVDGGDGFVQTGPPGAAKDFTDAIAGVSVPVIGHEVGQYTVFPDFREVSKYTGVFAPYNLEAFRDKLKTAGMLDQAPVFEAASGALAALCYRAEIEAALRTPGFAGFQLLDLQDFPGQGTALVGMLDAFMDSKGIITPEAWRRFCAPVVPLARFERYAWTADQTFFADLEVAQYGEADMPDAVLAWVLREEGGRVIAQGKFPAALPAGGLRPVGRLGASLEKVKAPAKLNLELRLLGTEWANDYPLWVYPAKAETEPPATVTVARTLDAAALSVLDRGGRVFLMPQERLASTVGGGFATDFWCWPTFKNTPGTMGLLIDPKAPALQKFPTESHSDWQWFEIAKSSQPVIMDGLPPGFPMIVQVIDNLDRDHRLGLIFEAKVGPGRLLVCAADLPGMSDDPAARQLFTSLLAYAASRGFQPKQEIPAEALARLLAPAAPAATEAPAAPAAETPAAPAAETTPVAPPAPAAEAQAE